MSKTNSKTQKIQKTQKTQRIQKTKKRSIKIKNPKVVAFSLIALVFIFLTFVVDWIFIIGAIILFFLNQRELMKPKIKTQR